MIAAANFLIRSSSSSPPAPARANSSPDPRRASPSASTRRPPWRSRKSSRRAVEKIEKEDLLIECRVRRVHHADRTRRDRRHRRLQGRRGRRGLQKRGHDVVAVMTASATRFVGPVTFEAITRPPCHHRPVRAGHERRHRAHRARVDASTCCSSRRPPPTSSASSPTASPTTSCPRCTSRRARPCSSRRR